MAAAVDTVKMRSITAILTEREEQEKTKNATPKELVESYQQSKDPATKDITAAYYKPKQNAVVLATTSLEARERLEEDTTWASATYKSTTVLVQSFPVRVHGVRLAAVDKRDPVGSIRRIQAENARPHPILMIRSLRWPKGASKNRDDGSRKRCSTLHIEVSTPEKVNRLVDCGTLEGSCLLTCERWEKGLEPVQTICICT